MTYLTPDQYSVMRATFEAHMPDLCTIRRRTNTLDNAGQPIASWSDDYTSVPCGFETSPFKFRAREIVAGGEGTSEILVRARMADDYYDLVDQEDRIVLTKRHGRTLATPEVYEIQGFEELGAAGMILNLKRVTP